MSTEPFSTATRLLLVALLLAASFGVHAFARSARPSEAAPVVAPSAAPAQRIEVVFVLDTTGSMSGLIEGAKRKIWSIASRMADTRGQTALRVGLVGYRDRGDAYVTRRVDLTEDLDHVYARLRELRAEGGGDTPESVNQALSEAIQQLSWSQGSEAYKVVFLVGDAPPHMDYQDDVPWSRSVRAARDAGIVVNTIQCGNMAETRALWSAIAREGAGQFAAIAQDGGMLALVAPMDEELARLNRDLADTVVAYGSVERRRSVSEKLVNAAEAPAPSAASRLSYLGKAGRKVISGAGDLIQDLRDGLSLDAVDPAGLPSSIAAMEPEERNAYLEAQVERRAEVQQRVDELVAERDAWVKEEEARRAASGRGDGFDQKVFETIRDQAAEKGIEY